MKKILITICSLLLLTACNTHDCKKKHRGNHHQVHKHTREHGQSQRHPRRMMQRRRMMRAMGKKNEVNTQK